MSMFEGTLGPSGEIMCCSLVDETASPLGETLSPLGRTFIKPSDKPLLKVFRSRLRSHPLGRTLSLISHEKTPSYKGGALR